MNKLQYFFMILIIIFTIFFIGLGVNNLIEKKLKNIKINIPKTINCELNKNVKEIKEKFTNLGLNEINKDPSPEPKKVTNVSYNTILPLNNNEYENSELVKSNKLKKEDERIYINPFIKNKEDDNLMKPKQNYQNPESMVSEERNAFKFGYPDNMTMQDYVNWLYLFKDKPNMLNLDHYTNLQKLENNVELEYKYGVTPPSSKFIPPLNSDNYFNNMYSSPPTIKEHKQPERLSSNQGSITNSLIPYNYSNYSNFPQNFDVYGGSGIITNPLLYRKINPKTLQKFVGPNILYKNIPQKI